MNLKKIDWTWWLNNKPPSQQEIADFYNIHKSSVSKWISSLERGTANYAIKAALSMFVKSNKKKDK